MIFKWTDLFQITSVKLWTESTSAQGADSGFTGKHMRRHTHTKTQNDHTHRFPELMSTNIKFKPSSRETFLAVFLLSAFYWRVFSGTKGSTFIFYSRSSFFLLLRLFLWFFPPAASSNNLKSVRPPWPSETAEHCGIPADSMNLSSDRKYQVGPGAHSLFRMAHTSPHYKNQTNVDSTHSFTHSFSLSSEKQRRTALYMGRAYCKQSSCCDDQLTLANIRHEKVGSQRHQSRPWAIFLQAKDRFIRRSLMGVNPNSRAALTPAPTALNSQNFPLFPETKYSASSFIHPVQSLQCENEHIQFLQVWRSGKTQSSVSVTQVKGQSPSVLTPPV